MLDRLRSAVNSWPAKILLGFILLSFIAWGGHSAFQRGNDDTLMNVKGTSVSSSTYDLTLRNEVLRLSMNIGRYLTPDEMKRFGIPQAVFGELYRNILLDSVAAQMELGVSDKSAAELLNRDLLFKGSNGNFDMNAFNFYIQTLRTSRDNFLNNFYIKAVRRNQIISTIESGAEPPEIFYKAVALYTKQTRSVDYAEILPTPIAAITDADAVSLAAWFKDNADRFRTPEYRELSYITLTPQDINDAKQVSEAEITAYYHEHQNQYLYSPETRSFTIVRFANKQSAETAYTAIKADMEHGQSATEAYNAYFAKQNTLKPETQTNIQLANLPTLTGKEIFALKNGEISNIINDLQDYSLVLLQNITPAQPKPLAEVSAQIKQKIILAKAAKLLPEYRKKIEDSRYDGANLKEVATQYHLPLHRITLSKDGQTPQGENADFLQVSGLLPNIFAAAENTDTDPLNLPAGGYLWYNVDKILPPHQSALSDVQAKVMAAWKAEQQEKRLDSRVTELAKQLNTGTNFTTLAEQNGLSLHHIANLNRTAKDKNLGEQAISAIFSAAKGESGVSVGAQEKSRILFRINNITEPQNAGRAILPTAEQSVIADHMATDLLSIYIGVQAQQTPVSVNRAVYNRIMQEQN